MVPLMTNTTTITETALTILANMEAKGFGLALNGAIKVGAPARVTFGEVASRFTTGSITAAQVDRALRDAGFTVTVEGARGVTFYSL